MKSVKYLLVAAISLSSSLLVAQEKDAVSGTMSINFGTRSDVDGSGNPKPGAKDVYTLNLKIHGEKTNTILKGKIERTPYAKGGWFSSDQKPQLVFDIVVDMESVATKTISKNLGKLAGTLPMDVTEYSDNGTKYDLVYDLENEILKRTLTKDNLLQLDMFGVNGTARVNKENFRGKIYGKQKSGKEEQKEANKNQGTAQKLWVMVGGKKSELAVGDTDPLKFMNLILPAGPTAFYPQATLAGDLNYVYKTDNWITQGISVTYTRGTPDQITGGIKYVTDETNANKSQYQIGLKFNEQAYYSGKAKEEDVVATSEEVSEDAVFSVDKGLPALTGTIDYVDTPKPGDAETPIRSDITFNIKQNRLQPHQVMTFAKLLLLIVGPLNDE